MQEDTPMATDQFDPAVPFTASPSLAVAQDVMPGADEPALRVEAPPEGGELEFAGLPGRVGNASWHRDRYLIVPVRQETDHSLFLHLIFTTREADGTAHQADLAMGVFPGLTVLLIVPLRVLDLETLFLPRTPGRLKNVSTGAPVDPERITGLTVVIPPSAGPQTIWLGRPRLADREPEYPIPAEPMVDALGQWTRKSWPGKTADEGELRAGLLRRAAEPLPPLDGPFDAYGGWSNLRFKPTGYFRTEHDGRRWWLVDPAGGPFFSTGADCLVPHMAGPVEGIEPLFAWLPPREGEFAAAWLTGKRDGLPQVSFATANLIRAFGRNWLGEWEKLAGKWLRAWGFNTVANWSLPGLGRRLGLPYVFELQRFPTTRECIFRDFPDVFSPEYRADAANCAVQLRETVEDPLLIGYFLRNEPHWGFGDYNLAEMLLASPKQLHTKDRLLAFLAERYDGDAAALARAWRRSELRDFTGLAQPTPGAARFSPEADEDLRRFTRIMIEEYVRVPAEAARREDPNHLNLGLRWAWVASEAFYAGSRYCDVFSINCYQLQPAPEEIRRHAAAAERPVMIGEFHAGALDVGLPSNGLRGVADQRERGRFYRWYVEHAAALPELVGAHYFQWGDQPALGRFDGENCNIGLVDICHRPYAELVGAVAETHRRLYEICAGLVQPVGEIPVEVPREGF